MKKLLIITSLVAATICGYGQNKKTYLKLHYFFEGKPSGARYYEGGRILNSKNNITLRSTNKNIKIGDTLIITYYQIPMKWEIETDHKSETCFRCNSPYFEGFKVIVLNKFTVITKKP